MKKSEDQFLHYKKHLSILAAPAEALAKAGVVPRYVPNFLSDFDRTSHTPFSPEEPILSPILQLYDVVSEQDL